jgi:hypothetical protein
MSTKVIARRAWDLYANFMNFTTTHVKYMKQEDIASAFHRFFIDKLHGSAVDGGGCEIVYDEYQARNHI